MPSALRERTLPSRRRIVSAHTPYEKKIERDGLLYKVVKQGTFLSGQEKFTVFFEGLCIGTVAAASYAKAVDKVLKVRDWE